MPSLAQYEYEQDLNDKALQLEELHAEELIMNAASGDTDACERIAEELDYNVLVEAIAALSEQNSRIRPGMSNAKMSAIFVDINVAKTKIIETALGQIEHAAKVLAPKMIEIEEERARRIGG